MSAYDDLVLSWAPVLYWPLDELAGAVAADASGHGRHGTYLGTPALGGSGPRLCMDPADKAAFFDGVGVNNGNVDMVHRAVSPISGTVDFTFGAWYRPAPDCFTRGSPFLYTNLFQQRVQRNSNGLVRILTNAGITVGIPLGFGLQLGEDVVIVGSLETLAARVGCWSFVALTRSGNTWRLTLNGALVGQTVRAFSVTPDNLSLGADYPDVAVNTDAEEQERFRGHIAKAVLFDRALTPAEVGELVARGCTSCGAGWAVGRLRMG
jgi:hypothetical protein